MTPPAPSTKGRSGFTLIELILAISIFVLVVGTVYASLRAATQALVVGRASMELYQTSRSGMNRMMMDFRKALAPASFPFNDEEDDPELTDDEYFARQEDKEQLHVTFKGDAKQVQFVIRQEIEQEEGTKMDIREVRYHLDDKKQLVKEVYRSLLEARLAELLSRRMEERAPEEHRFRKDGRRSTPPPADEGYFDKPIIHPICENVQEVKFAYFDGENWKDTWDSEEVVLSEFSRDIDEAELSDEDEEKVGLPKLVRCEIQVAEEVRLSCCTEVPTADLNIVAERRSESDFGTAYKSTEDRRERLRNGERSGNSSRRDRSRRRHSR